jgi:hypothetical protein
MTEYFVDAITAKETEILKFDRRKHEKHAKISGSF